ncbi:hypothetical protein ACWGCW_26275 [Streptomyces sp. NPDC054933]
MAGVLCQAQEEVVAAQERAECARVAREELVQALFEEGENGAGSASVDVAAAGPGTDHADLGPAAVAVGPG